MNLTADEILDARGLLCPEPVMMLHKAVRQLQAGQVLQVLATDPSTQRDIPKFCTFLQHSLLQSNEQGGEFCYWIRKQDGSQ
ncbi:MAG: sulfurtransferase TusA [Thiopseudomonas sp.]|nr:sulfurtransferase TusA [Gammaproteobacteria bacterium]